MTPPGPGDPRLAAAPSRVPAASLFFVFVLGIFAAGWLSYRASAADVRRQRERELSAIAALKVDELERWQDERMVDADLIAASVTLRGPGSPAGALRSWFEALASSGDYSDVLVVDSNGNPVGSGSELGDDVDIEAVRAVMRRAMAERRPLLSDVHRHGMRDRLHLTLVAPLPGGGGAAVLRIDPYRSLFRMIQSWPTPSPTAETLLVRAEGDHVVFVNELRHWADDPGALTVPLVRSDDPAVRAVLGNRGVVEGIDYRGNRVLAAIEPVPETPWFLVAKVDASEALAPLAELRLSVIVVVLALAAAAAALASLWWRSHREAFERARFRAEAERETLTRKLDALQRYAHDIVILSDEALRIVEVNDRAIEAFRCPRDALIGKPVRMLHDPAAVDEFDQRIVAQLASGAAVFETRYQRANGTTFPVEVSVHADVYDGRRYFQAMARDISERKRAEEALRASEEKFRAAFEFASLGIVLAGPDGRIVETNRAFRRMLGYAEDEIRGLSLAEIDAPGQGKPAPAAMLARMHAGEVDTVEVPRRYLRKDGSLVEATLRATALRDASGTFRFSLAVVEDVSEKKRMEAQLLLAERMASVGTLAAGVAHEINNPLAFILANLEYALTELRLAAVDPEILRALEEAKDGGARVREIVRDLKSFSRVEEEAREPVDVHRVLQSAIALAQNEIRHRAQLSVELGEIPRVLASEHRLAQVFLNLLVNAAQAIPEGRAAEHRIVAETSTAPDGRAQITISDSGAGIAPELLPHIFDPFFTTKPVGIGTGLGLSICHGIVTALGGEISVDSTPGRGSMFRVLLPAARGVVLAERREASPTAPVRRARILVVDDEPLIGRAVSRILAPQHEVVARTSARAALETITGGDRAWDLVLCDLMMPEMTGMELHARLVELEPRLAARTVFLTGGAFTPAAREFLERVPNARFEKPFEPDALRDVVALSLAPEPEPEPAARVAVPG